ncbi:MAG: hypothetical protein TEF_02040 [Rhizobiales bacterium NRL2]|jgi:hypothetical protein|nr:MAG: hypothetical protein TEF_02040 [Rhizobiales bacterium NRL2]
MSKVARWIGPIILLAVVAAGVGYWFYWNALADGLERGFNRWVEQRRAEGVSVRHGAVEVTGFPYRLELHVAQPEIAAPRLNMAPEWSADEAVIYFQPWKRGHAIAETRGPQKLGWIEGGVQRRATVVAERALSSVRFTDRGRITRYDADLVQVEASGDLALRRAARLQSHGRLADAGDSGPPALELTFRGDEMRVDPAASPLGEAVDLARIAVTLAPMPESTAPSALDAWRDRGGVLEVNALDVRTGELAVTGDGTFALDAARRPEGAGVLQVFGAEAFVDALAAAGDLSGGAQLGLKLAIKALEQRDGEGRAVVRVPFSIQDGRVRLLEFGLFDAPPLY